MNIIESYIDWARGLLGKNINVIKERHGDQSDVYRLQTSDKSYYLKIGENLDNEHARLIWLQDKLPVPKVIGFVKLSQNSAILTTAVNGKNLAVLAKEWKPEEIVDKLAIALKQVHSASMHDCPFGVNGDGKVLVHGDACLPNFIFDGDNFSGYVDLGDLMIAYPEIDLAASIWSLQYNLGRGYGILFLKKYGIKNANDEMVEKLLLKYENMQEEWGLL